ncbi:MAG: aminotransferase class V-fold PLP-dependent enzyme, partial [Spirochaetales bacterium]
MTYFDWAATGVVDENILQEAMHILIEYGANPSSIHDAGIAAKHKLEEARQRCAKALGVSAQTIIFTSGGTESNCLPIISLLQRQAKGSILINATEHATVREQAYAMERCGWNVIQIPCDNRGIVQPDSVVRLLQDDTALVCVIAVNNETG